MRRDVRVLRDAKPADTNPREIKDIAR